MFENSNEHGVPVVLITGFLGSGKTTLLNKLIKHPSMKGAGVIINEFGTVPLDQHFVEVGDGKAVVLGNGCLCCVASGDFETSLGQIYELGKEGKGERLERLLIETTGLADPAPIMQFMLNNPLYTRLYRLDRVVCTIDAVHGARQLADYREAAKQVALADRILMTKTDIASSAQRAATMAALRAINPQAPVDDVLFGDIDPPGLLGDASGGPRRQAVASSHDHRDSHDHDHAAEHTHGITTFTLTIDAPLDWLHFARWFRRLRIEHGEQLLRVKGMLNVQGEALPLAIHAVHHVFHPPTRLPAWPTGTRNSTLVFIVQELSRETVEESWRRHYADAVPAYQFSEAD